MRVGDCMTGSPQFLSPNASMREAVTLLQRHHIRHIPIVEGGSLVGIVSDRDVRRAAPSLLSGIDQSEYDAVLDSTLLSRIMTRQPLTVSPDSDVIEAVRILVDKKVDGLPVVGEGRLVGMFTSSDALRVLLDVLDSVPS